MWWFNHDMGQITYSNIIDLFQHYLYNTVNVEHVEHCVWWSCMNIEYVSSHSQYEETQVPNRQQKWPRMKSWTWQFFKLEL